MNVWLNILALLFAIAVPLAGGFLSGYFSGGFRGTWYDRLRKPSWQPPSWLFMPVWTALYVLMGIASWLLWRAPSSALRSVALVLYVVQLGMNFAWTPIFNKGHIKAALGVLAALDVIVLSLIVAAAQVRPWAAVLLVPYMVWISFATSLNAAIVRLN